MQNAYTHAIGGLLLLGARAGDLLGRRRMFLVGLELFTAASLAISLAQSSAWIVTARAVQGVGAAVLAPSTLALLTTSFWEGPERTRALGYCAATAGVRASVGLVLGGVVTDLLSWRVGFALNVPIGLALMVITAPRVLPETERRPARWTCPARLGSALGLSALVYGLVRSADAGWNDALTGAALGAGSCWSRCSSCTSGAAQPILPLRLFASRERAGAYAVRVLPRRHE